MKHSRPFIILIGIFVLVTAVFMQPAIAHQPEAPTRQTANVAIPVGDKFPVWEDADLDASNPAVAHCAGDQYLVVFEFKNAVNNTEIYGQYLDSEGNALGDDFMISTDSHNESSPAIACDWSYNQFIVVWQHDFMNSGDMDIRARAVRGVYDSSSSPFVGDVIQVAASSQNETQSAVACNNFAFSCLVVFQYESNNGDISGQRVAVGSSGLSSQGSQFYISTYTNAEGDPAVAWGSQDGNYYVAWEYAGTTSRILAAYVYDTEQSGSQLQMTPTYVTSDDYLNHQFNPAVAYNGRSQRYLVVFQYDYHGTGSDYDIYGLRQIPGGGSIGPVIPIAYSFEGEFQPAVAYGSGPYYLPGGYGADQFLVTYKYSTDTVQQIRAQAVSGPYRAGKQLVGGPAVLESVGGGVNFGLNNPAVLGSINNGRYLTVWDKRVSGFSGDNYDVWGKFLDPYGVFLPLVIR